MVCGSNSAGGREASRLLAEAESWAASNGYSEVVLDTAEPAHHLIEPYRRRGVGFVQWQGKCYRSVLMAGLWRGTQCV